MRVCVWCPHTVARQGTSLWYWKEIILASFPLIISPPAYSFSILFWTFLKSLLADSLIAKPLCPELESKHRPGTVYVDCVEGCLLLSAHDTPLFLWGVIAIKLPRRTETNREEKRGMQGGKCYWSLIFTNFDCVPDNLTRQPFSPGFDGFRSILACGFIQT